MKPVSQNKAKAAPENKGKAAAPGQQAPGSTTPTPGKSAVAERGHSEAQRQLREEERNIARAKEQAENGGGELVNEAGVPVDVTGKVIDPDAALEAAQTMPLTGRNPDGTPKV